MHNFRFNTSDELVDAMAATFVWVILTIYCAFWFQLWIFEWPFRDIQELAILWIDARIRDTSVLWMTCLLCLQWERNEISGHDSCFIKWTRKAAITHLNKILAKFYATPWESTDHPYSNAVHIHSFDHLYRLSFRPNCLCDTLDFVRSYYAASLASIDPHSVKSLSASALGHVSIAVRDSSAVLVVAARLHRVYFVRLPFDHRNCRMVVCYACVKMLAPLEPNHRLPLHLSAVHISHSIPALIRLFEHRTALWSLLMKFSANYMWRKKWKNCQVSNKNSIESVNSKHMDEKMCVYAASADVNKYLNCVKRAHTVYIAIIRYDCVIIFITEHNLHFWIFRWANYVQFGFNVCFKRSRWPLLWQQWNQ